MTSFRTARVGDYWRDTYKLKYPIKFGKIKCTNGLIFPGLSLDLNTGISAIVGKNGIGKSNYMRLLYNTFASEDSNRRRFSSLLDACEMEIEFAVQSEGNEFVSMGYKINHADQNPIICDQISAYIYDPCSLIPEIQAKFVDQENVGELLESRSKITFTDDEITTINFLTNNTYTSIEVFNIEEEYEEFPQLPFFKVVARGIEYDSRGMGLGELSLFYLYWLVLHIGKDSARKILFVEEPESFVPPLIQIRLASLLAMLSSSTRTTMLISTHSEHIIKRIPRTHIQIMSRIDQRIKFSAVANNVNALKVLGLESPKIGFILYEDYAARLMIESLIRGSKEYVIDSFYWHKCGSWSSILQIIENVGSRMGSVLVLGILDGDCRDNNNVERLMPADSNVLFLPGNEPPENPIIRYLNSKPQLAAEKLSVNQEDFLTAAGVAEGSDLHDYFQNLAGYLEQDYQTVLGSLCDVWANDVDNSESVQAFVNELELLNIVDTN